MKELKHENLVQFFGVCIEPPNVCLVMQYCRKGSLKVELVLENVPPALKLNLDCCHFLLQDVLRDSDIELDGIFKLSFAYDIVNVSPLKLPEVLDFTDKFILDCLFVFKGMEFIHKSNLRFHGNLKPSTCLVDSRLQIKLSGFGLCEFKYGTRNQINVAENTNYSGQ